MTKAKEYMQALKEAQDIETYLLSKSGLPGPRSNLELLYVAAGSCDESLLRKWLATFQNLVDQFYGSFYRFIVRVAVEKLRSWFDIVCFNAYLDMF